MKKNYTIFSRLAFTLFSIACLQSVKAQNIYLVDAAHTGITTATPVPAVTTTAWNNATGNLQAALDAATTNGGQVWMKKGTYYPTAYPDGCIGCNDERDKAFFLRNNEAVYGGFAGTETMLTQRNLIANPTILSGDIGAINDISDNSYHIVVSINNNNSSILDGFIIANANATGYGSRNIMGQSVDQSSGGGMYNVNSSPTVTNCNFISNNCSEDGGGIYNNNSSPVISYCNFSANLNFGNGSNSSSHDGGGIANISSSPIISYSGFVSNYAASSGGAIFNSSSSATITNCFFSMNNCSTAGGGIANLSSSATITNCSFSVNYSNHGGGISNSYSSSIAITNCVFNSNGSSEGGAIYNNSSSPTITNSTFYTIGDIRSWSLYNSNSNPIISNTIIWSSNSGAGISNQSSSPVISYSIVKGGYNGTGNQNVDPLFVNAASPAGVDSLFGTADDGLALQCGSPAINAGSNAFVAAGALTDVTNAPRIQGGTVDIGAYEYQSARGTPSLAINGDIATYTVKADVTTQFVTNCRLIASVMPTGNNPATGDITAKIFVEPSQPNYNGQAYSKRHYQLTAANNPTTSTARITLYATQQEFNDFNNYSTNTSLPTGPNDMAGIAKLRISKYNGQSSDGTGTPGSYPQPGVEINPDDNDIIYNNSLNRWEITFNITGFSGFFIGNSGMISLPLSLLSFDSKMYATNNILINWRTTNEVNTGYFDLQRSGDGRNYATISTTQAKGTTQSETVYNYIDKSLQPGLYYYRLHIVDKDGKEKYSQVITVVFSRKEEFVVYPVPAKEVAWINGNNLTMIGKNLQLTDMQGRVLQIVRISQWPQKIDINLLSSGNYLVKLPDNTTLKMVKE